MFGECALLTLLKLVGFEAWAKRSRFARDGEEGRLAEGVLLEPYLSRRETSGRGE